MTEQTLTQKYNNIHVDVRWKFGMLAKCPPPPQILAKCPLAECPLAKCPLAKCPGFILAYRFVSQVNWIHWYIKEYYNW